MTEIELEEVRTELEELTEQGFILIRSITSGEHIEFSSLKYGWLRTFVDFRAINGWTYKNGYPVPLVHVTLDRFISAK